MLKFFLHLSKDEQRQRLLDRLNDPAKHWKFDEADLAERDRWKDYQRAFEDALSATSMKKAPWHIIPADRKYVARALVAEIIVAAINSLELKYPEASAEQKAKLEAARVRLESEC